LGRGSPPRRTENAKWSFKLNIVPGDQISAIIGEFVDVEGITALKDMFNRLDSDNFDVRSNNVKLNPDLRSNFIMNSHITGRFFNFRN